MEIVPSNFLSFSPYNQPLLFFIVAVSIAIVSSLFFALLASRSFPLNRNLDKPMPSTPLANGTVNGNADSASLGGGERAGSTVTNAAVVDDKPGVSMMEQLVPEITTHALSYLDYPSLCRLSMTNSLMRKAANDDNAWKALYHKDFTLEQDTITPVNGWKAYYATTRAIIGVNTEFFNIIRDRSRQAMARLWMNSDYVKCIHASGELFSGYNEVMQGWQLCFNWEQGFDFQVHTVRTRILTDMAWVTMKAYLNMDGGPFLITNVFEFHNGRWHMVHHHSSVMLLDDVNQQQEKLAQREWKILLDSLYKAGRLSVYSDKL